MSLGRKELESNIGDQTRSERNDKEAYFLRNGAMAVAAHAPLNLIMEIDDLDQGHLVPSEGQPYRHQRLRPAQKAAYGLEADWTHRQQQQRNNISLSSLSLYIFSCADEMRPAARLLNLKTEGDDMIMFLPTTDINLPDTNHNSFFNKSAMLLKCA